jgi:hypothetical protein
MSSSRNFDKVQQELDDTLWNLRGTRDPEFRRALIQKMRRLLDEAHQLADKK